MINILIILGLPIASMLLTFFLLRDKSREYFVSYNFPRGSGCICLKFNNGIFDPNGAIKYIQDSYHLKEVTIMNWIRIK